MTGTGSNKKKSFLRKNLDLVFVFLVFTPVYYAHALTQPISPFVPREESFAPYERHTHFSFHFPFVTSYFLMAPEGYDPSKYTYPLVVMLHGVSRHMYGGKVLADPVMRDAFPFFALIPIAPFGFSWALPDRFTLRPQALPAAMSVTRSVMKKYSVNPEQVYLTGYSMGGLGVYGALARYHGIFAAAVPTDGLWNPDQVAKFDDIPVWIVHGAWDTDVPVEGARAVAAAMQGQERQVFYTEYPDRGHGAWERVYDSPEFWAWLLQQKRHE